MEGDAASSAHRNCGDLHADVSIVNIVLKCSLSHCAASRCREAGSARQSEQPCQLLQQAGCRCGSPCLTLVKIAFINRPTRPEAHGDSVVLTAACAAHSRQVHVCMDS